MDDPNRVKEKAKNIFEARLSEVSWERPKLDGVHFKSIVDQDNDMLLANFLEVEL